MRSVLLACLLAAAGPAAAGEKPAAEAPAPEPTAAPVSGMAGREPTDVLRFEALVIEGRAQKPQALDLLRRTTVSFADLVPDEPLLPRILDAVESEPF